MSLERLLLPPTASQVNIIREELGENADRFENNLKLLEKWMECQPHMPKNYDRNMLPIYLRGSKHDMEVAKRKLQLFFMYKNTVPEILVIKEFTAQEKKIANNIIVMPLPRLSDEGNRVTIFGLKSSDPDLFDIDVGLKLTWKFGNVRTCKEKMIGGEVFIFDGKNLTPAHIGKFITPLLKKSIHMGQEAFSGRFRRIHVMNAPRYVDKLVTFTKLLVKEKLRDRFSVEQGTSALADIVSEKCLPKDYGGSERSCDELRKDWDDYFKENANWFVEQALVKTTGPVPKELENSCGFEDFNGMQGSFRQLAID